MNSKLEGDNIEMQARELPALETKNQASDTDSEKRCDQEENKSASPSEIPAPEVQSGQVQDPNKQSQEGLQQNSGLKMKNVFKLAKEIKSSALEKKLREFGHLEAEYMQDIDLSFDPVYLLQLNAEMKTPEENIKICLSLGLIETAEIWRFLDTVQQELTQISSDGSSAIWKKGNIKLVAVGDSLTGKSGVLKRYATGALHDGSPTIPMNRYEKTVIIGGESIGIFLWDTNGLEAYNELRLLAYPQSDVLIICFSLDDPTSLQNVRSKWYPEVRHHCHHQPIVLVGNQMDLRSDPDHVAKTKLKGLTPITYNQGLQMAKDIGAAKYVECSAKTGEGVDDVFDEAIKAVLYPSGEK